MINWTKKEAREYLVKYHMINTDTSLKDKDGIMKVFDKICSIQVDPLDVVGRNVDLVIQSRVQDYKKYFVEELLYKDKTLIDGWDKMMSIFKTEDYPYFYPIREYRAESEINTLKYRLQLDALNYTEEVLNILKDEGPKYSKDLFIGGKKKTKWGQTKISGAVLDYLYHRGDINVCERKNNQKCYDLTENIIGELALSPNPFKTKSEFIEWYLLRRIKALGLATNKSGVHMSGLYIDKKTTRDEYIKILLEKNLIQEVQIEGFKNSCYIPKDAHLNQDDLNDKISFIAPLDNILWDRDLLNDLFDFHYRWEVYTPVVKREYGYYVLPILYESQFIGRIEFDKHRGNEELKVLNIWYEPNIKVTKKIELKLSQALKRFQKYLINQS